MNNKQLELIGKYDARRVKGGVPSWLLQCEGETIAEKVWLHFHERPLCRCGKKTTFLTYPTGYRKACSLSCGQALIATEKSVRQERLWANDSWKERTSAAMKAAHHVNRTQAKLDKLALKGIKPLDQIKPGMANTYRWQHTCGEIFMRPFTRVTGIWCPACHVSRGRGELYETIRAMYDGPIFVNGRAAIRPKEIDIYLPELKLGFEYHGEYWHPGDGTREADKIKLAASKGIHLEEVWETLWKHKRVQQIAKLKELLKRKEGLRPLFDVASS